MAKKREMVHSPIRKSRLDECVNCSKTDDHSARKLLAKHSEIDAGRGRPIAPILRTNQNASMVTRARPELTENDTSHRRSL